MQTQEEQYLLLARLLKSKGFTPASEEIDWENIEKIVVGLEERKKLNENKVTFVKVMLDDSPEQKLFDSFYKRFMSGDLTKEEEKELKETYLDAPDQDCDGTITVIKIGNKNETWQSAGFIDYNSYQKHMNFYMLEMSKIFKMALEDPNLIIFSGYNIEIDTIDIKGQLIIE